MFGGKHFRVSTVLCSKGYGVSLQSLVDTGAQGFLFLNSAIARTISSSLQVPIRRLPFKITVKGFQDQVQTRVNQYIRLHLSIDGRKIYNCPFVIMDLGSQDCIIGIKWLRRFQLQLDTVRNRIVWPAKYPATYDPAPPILVQLKQPTVDTEVEKDIERRNALWEKDEYRRRKSPASAWVGRIRGILQLPTAHPSPPASDATPKST